METNNSLNYNKSNNYHNRNSFRNRISNFFAPFKNPKILAEIAIFTALATVLSEIIIYVMPQGGSITLASMVPIIWLSLRRGPKVGIVTGTIYGIIQFMLLPYAINPFQVLFDYPLAFAVLGLAGFFPNKPVLGATVAIAGRFLMHFIAGAIWWAPVYAPDIDPIIYSSVYNASYLLPELVISGVALYILQKSNVLKAYM
ncbi:MAG: energy-coupled thiamine transporter ThiT [Candidatus Bathyarchaeia archaeon]